MPSIMTKSNYNYLSKKKFTIYKVKWNNHYATRDIIGFTLDFKSNPFERKCWINIHIPEQLDGELIENNHINIEPFFSSATQGYNFGNDAFKISYYSDKIILNLPNVLVNNNMYELNIQIEFPEPLRNQISKISNFCNRIGM